MTVVTGEEILYAVEVANKLREIAGEDKVTDLLPGRPNMPTSCVLARTFNCSCKIERGFYSRLAGGSSHDYVAIFYDEIYAKALADQLSVQVTEDDYKYYVLLPDNVGKIAREFDYHSLDNKYYL